MTETVLKVEGLTKYFDGFCAVNGISFSLQRGQVLGLLGPNGAGKTTTIHMLLGLTTYEAGSVRYFGDDLQRHRAGCLNRINFTSSYNTLQGRISVVENLRVFAMLYGITDASRKIADLISYFEIEDIAGQRFWDLSAGQKTRVNIIKSMLNDPEILLMDEPTASLDPDIADKTLALIERLRRDRQISILYTSHNMAEVSRVCDSVIILNRGAIVAHDTPRALTQRIPEAELRVVVPDDQRSALAAWLDKNDHRYGEYGTHGFAISLVEGRLGQVLSDIAQSGFSLVDVDIERPTLEDVFMQIARSN